MIIVGQLTGMPRLKFNFEAIIAAAALTGMAMACLLSHPAAEAPQCCNVNSTPSQLDINKVTLTTQAEPHRVYVHSAIKFAAAPA